MSEQNVAATLSYLAREHERKNTRITAAAVGLGKLGMALLRYNMNPDMCLAPFSDNPNPVYWTKLSKDYMECLCVLANTDPSGRCAIYKAVYSFLREFPRTAEAIRPWMIFIVTDGHDEHTRESHGIDAANIT